MKRSRGAFVETIVKTTKDQHESPGISGGLFFTMHTTVSIQGYEGSFHQVAAQHFYGKDRAVVPCATSGKKVIRSIRPLTEELHIYCIYKKGIWK